VCSHRGRSISVVILEIVPIGASKGVWVGVAQALPECAGSLGPPPDVLVQLIHLLLSHHGAGQPPHGASPSQPTVLPHGPLPQSLHISGVDLVIPSRQK